ncbi:MULTISPECIES: hypothetical protein [unclassified Cryobacterium]|uniref:hypothetical protein n=1 Tax=unclassified Cryobacterium TaxID=2649013 RepID=UPI002AB51AD5|nr:MULTISPECIES: hypothetical protein [unclassified Cryobacterium]MDY7542997.1 hypothetical protein [Cryobacterium sp. 5B3]MEA9999294.1 hypothetical protein [Cryobacterium sp. RTS3]MEB0266112.1 hypothetical protein [Cryobacterium sp. 10I5]MEB0274060.1 hypothetical protein [Cryobacterium sp. 5B3]
MKLNNKIRFAAVGVVSLALVAGASMVASASVQTNGSAAPVYLYDTNAAQLADGVTLGWTDDLIGSSAQGDINGEFACPVGTTGIFSFLAAPGTENVPNTWKAFAPLGFNGTSLNVLNPFLTPSSMINGAQGAVKAAGGNYSLGLACTNLNGVAVTAGFYRSIVVTPVTGAFTVAAQADVVVTPTPTPTPTATAPAGTTGTVALAPTTANATNGALALTVPAGAAATFSAPSLVNNKSTTVGTLGAVTVNDGRVVSRNGWDLSANVANFVNSTDATSTISKVQLGLAPSVTVAGTSATGVTAAAAQVAGSASYPAAFASGAAANTVGDSVLNAGLTFVAPQEKAAGTYTSTLTLTVVSK